MTVMPTGRARRRTSDNGQDNASSHMTTRDRPTTGTRSAAAATSTASRRWLRLFGRHGQYLGTRRFVIRYRPVDDLGLVGVLRGGAFAGGDHLGLLGVRA